MPTASGPRSRIPRRALLTGAGAAVAMGALLQPEVPAQTPPPKRTVDLRGRWIDVITARTRLDPTSPRVRQHLASMDNDVRSYLKSAAESSEGPDAFSRYPFDGENADAFSLSATWLAKMARAWATPASEFSNNEDVRDVILTGVQRLLAGGYHEGATTYDNWWDWEIGTPRPLADLMCVMRDELPDQVMRDAGAAIRYFIPDPTYSRLSDYPSTASNLTNSIRGALIASIAENDTRRIQECIDAFPSIWRIVDELDGFYADGGFIQHLDIPYTGNYGVDLLQNLTPMLLLLHGTQHRVVNREALWGLIESSYLPVIVNGHMLDAVRGRAVARISVNGSVAGRNVVSAIAELAQIAPESRSSLWMAQIRRWASQNRTVDLLEGADLPGAVSLERATRGRAAPIESPSSTYFASMDRLVHRADGWTLAVSMCSNRIGTFEGSEAENSRGVLTGNAMRYLFVNDDPAPFDDFFWATLDYSRPPGVTSHRIALEPMVTGGGANNVPDNEWTGGLIHGKFSIVAMHQTGLAGEAPRCRRFSVATDKAVFELVSDIKSDRHSFTTVENRNLPNNIPGKFAVDGLEVLDRLTIKKASWAHIEGVGGYIFPEASMLEASLTRRIGSVRRVENEVAKIPDRDRVARNWATLDLLHEGSAESSSWMLLPGAGVSDTRETAKAFTSGDPPIRVAQNDNAAQIVEIGTATSAAAVWSSSEIRLTGGARIHCPHPILLIAEETGNKIQFRLTDPTQTRQHAELVVTGDWVLDAVEGISPDDVSVQCVARETRVTAQTRDRSGTAFTVRLSAC